MEKYETPIMAVLDFRDDIRTNDVIIDSVIDKGDNNEDMIGPW